MNKIEYTRHNIMPIAITIAAMIVILQPISGW